jgi:hypothetical protein
MRSWLELGRWRINLNCQLGVKSILSFMCHSSRNRCLLIRLLTPTCVSSLLLMSARGTATGSSGNQADQTGAWLYYWSASFLDGSSSISKDVGDGSCSAPALFRLHCLGQAMFQGEGPATTLPTRRCRKRDMRRAMGHQPKNWPTQDADGGLIGHR